LIEAPVAVVKVFLEEEELLLRVGQHVVPLHVEVVLRQCRLELCPVPLVVAVLDLVVTLEGVFSAAVGARRSEANHADCSHCVPSHHAGRELHHVVDSAMCTLLSVRLPFGSTISNFTPSLPLFP
jgi:hypothetical protein